MHSKTDNSLLATAASVRCGHFMVSANFRVDADCAHIVIGVTLPFFLSSSSVLFFHFIHSSSPHSSFGTFLLHLLVSFGSRIKSTKHRMKETWQATTKYISFHLIYFFLVLYFFSSEPYIYTLALHTYIRICAPQTFRPSHWRKESSGMGHGDTMRRGNIKHNK